ncbi:MAG: GNAT family N-acetyltransferase [Lewinella sp.]|nr:GNAT family N-acetyltransferase [Lewinella sp.]
MNHPPADGIVTLEARMIERKKHMEQGLMLYLIVLLRKNLEFIGSFALEDLKEANPEMGGWLKKGAQGQGYGKEIVTALKAWSDDHLNYQYIIWHCAQANVASCKLAELLNGRTVRAYRKTNQTGYTWDYLEYHIPK